MEALLAVVLLVVAVAAAMMVIFVPLALLRGWAIQTLWGWFIVPTFGMRPLRIVEALGMSLFIGLFTSTVQTKKDDKGGTDWSALATAFLCPLIGVGLGWIVRQWM